MVAGDIVYWKLGEKGKTWIWREVGTKTGTVIPLKITVPTTVKTVTVIAKLSASWYITLGARVIETMISTSTSNKWEKLKVWLHGVFFIKFLEKKTKHHQEKI